LKILLFHFFVFEMANVSSIMVATIAALVVVAALISTRFRDEVRVGYFSSMDGISKAISNCVPV
jgi:hypothetical protein